MQLTRPARYDATRAERRYLVVDAENPLVARGLETAWEKALTALTAAETELARRERARTARGRPPPRARRG